MQFTIDFTYVVLEGLFQGVSDTFDEEGICYGTGYLAGSLIGVKGLDKVSKLAKVKLLSKSGALSKEVEVLIAVLDPKIVKKLDDLHIKPDDYAKLGIVSKETAEAAVSIISKIKAGSSDMLSDIRNIIRRDGYYEFITSDGKILRMADDTIPAASRKVIEGASKTLKNLNGLDDFLNDPSKLKNVKPDELYNYLKNNGHNPQPLSGGSLKGVSFEDGGGFKVNWGGDRILQYHPAGKG